MMQQTVTPSRETCLKALEAILFTRFLDEKMSKLVRQNKGGTFHLPVTGHEMVGALAGLSLTSEKDWGLPYYRDRGFAVGIGCTATELLGAFLARTVPHHSGGRMMPEHFSHKRLRLPCQSSCVGSQFLQAVGVAKGVQHLGNNDVVYVSAGDGATSQGDFHEALNFASLHKLGVIFSIQDNGWAISVPACEQTSGASISTMMQGYADLTIVEIDGCDYEQVADAFGEAVKKGRQRLGPTLIISKVPRIGAHSSSDDPSKYKTPEILAAEKEKDPLPRFEAWLQESGLFTQTELEETRKRIFEAVEKAAVEADAFPHPKPESVTDHVFKEVAPIEAPVEGVPSSPPDAVVMVDALNHALHEEMARDPNIVVFGQDVAHGKGGVFGVTRGLTAQFGSERCFNSPLAESTIAGLAIGMSVVNSVKPVAEIQFADYMWTGINQIINELASIHYRSNGEWNCPAVIRMPYGGYIQGGPYHSQSVEAYLCHTPGLKVVIPSNAADAKRLLKAAIRDPNPVIFLEHKALYRQRVFCARKEPGSDEILPLGKAHVVRPGKDLTFVGWGMMVVQGYDVAEELEKEGISVEVIDLRTLAPLDMETVLTSVRKTGKVVVAHEAAGTCGFGAEIAARIAEEAFSYLDAPPVRVTGKNCPVPYSKILEDAVLPQKEDLARAMRHLASF
jgi:2-oxoisovalerate dehydrogenase E1 component